VVWQGRAGNRSPYADSRWGSTNMKITINIPDFIYGRLRRYAAEEASTVSVLIVRAIEQYLEERKPKPRRRVKLPIVRSKRPGKLPIDSTRIYELISFP